MPYCTALPARPCKTCKTSQISPLSVVRVAMALVCLLCLLTGPAVLSAKAQDTTDTAPDIPLSETEPSSQPAQQDPPNTQPAVTTQKAAPQQQQAGRRTAVLISHTSTDNAGTRLAFRLKEQFNQSSLFRLSDRDEKKIKLLLSTREEFASRPHLGSIYCAIWVFSAQDNVLTHYLDSETGFVDTTTAQDLAKKLIAKTDTIAVRYSYLFE